MPARAASPSSWREVEARVHLALTPQQLAGGARNAVARLAFDSLLMRYNARLGGVVVAHRGAPCLQGAAKFVGASPFPHVTATTRLLIFSPPPGMAMVGVVTHVGPDHVGMSVLQAFHAVLPMEGLKGRYAYHGDHWKCKNPPSGEAEGERDMSLGRQVRFEMDVIRPTRVGLFQIMASLDRNRETVDERVAPSAKPLGVIPCAEELEIPMIPVTPMKEEEDEADDEELEGPLQTHVLNINKHSSIERSRLSVGSDVFASNDFGDALMPTPNSEKIVVAAKKRRRASTGEKLHSKSSKSKRKSLKTEAGLQLLKSSQASTEKGSTTNEGKDADSLRGQVLTLTRDEQLVAEREPLRSRQTFGLAASAGKESTTNEENAGVSIHGQVFTQDEQLVSKGGEKREDVHQSDGENRHRRSSADKEARRKEKLERKKRKERKREKKERKEQKEKERSARKQKKKEMRQKRNAKLGGDNELSTENVKGAEGTPKKATTDRRQDIVAAAVHAVGIVTDVEKTAQKTKVSVNGHEHQVKAENEETGLAIENGYGHVVGVGNNMATVSARVEDGSAVVKPEDEILNDTNVASKKKKKKSDKKQKYSEGHEHLEGSSRKKKKRKSDALQEKHKENAGEGKQDDAAIGEGNSTEKKSKKKRKRIKSESVEEDGVNNEATPSSKRPKKKKKRDSSGGSGNFADRLSKGLSGVLNGK